MSPYLPREIWILTNFELIQLSQHNFKWKKERMKKKFWGVIWGCDMSPYLPREIWILTNFELIQLSRYGVPIRA